ncbi:hypothetical protein CK625_06000 [Vandammella animalimorsus]|uniref:TonB-dependent siderophore receptor n=2 Tax=Vandammella animalimorsus TaxID=2029117 RepID=A0A2A2AJL6_9BURK|nr:hypothetical protein CK625_06000 [Vandammella animalimorsus]
MRIFIHIPKERISMNQAHRGTAARTLGARLAWLCLLAAAHTAAQAQATAPAASDRPAPNATAKTAAAQAAPSSSAAPELPTVEVFAAPQGDWLDFQDINASGLKQAAPLLETPQAVSTVNSALMQAQGSHSLLESLRYTPGFLAQYGDGDVRADWVMIRGHIPYKYLDGMRLPYGLGYGDSRIDAWLLERVEVLKGPSSVLYGANVPTGLLAMYSKLPDARQRRQIALDAGSHGLRQARLDVGGQWGDGRWLWRLAGLGSRDGNQMEHVRERRWALVPSLTLRPDGPGGRTRFTLHAMLRHADAPGGGAGPAWLPPEGTVWPNPHGRIPLGRFLGEPDYDHFSGRTRHLGYVLHTRLSERWALRHRLRHARTDNHMRSVNQDFGGIHADLRHVGRSVGQTREDTRALTSDTQLSGRFDWGPVRHQLLLGWDTRRERSDFERLSGGRAAPLDLFQPIYGQPWQLPTRRYATQPTASQSGVYLQDQMHMGQWVATLGLRHDRLRLGQSGAPSSHYRATTGRLGLNWLMGNGWAPYLAYAQGFEPVAGQDRHGRLFQPSRSQQWELGLRYQPEDRNLTVSASLFALRQHKALTRDPDPAESPICDRACQVQQGRSSTRGLELEARAQLGKQMHLNASYAYTHARITHSHIPGEAGSAVPDVPRHQAALWLDWRIAQGPLAGLTLYGGARHTGQRAWHGRPGQHIPAHTLLDAGLDYDLGQAHAALAGYHFALSVKNLANRAHVASCYGPTVCYWSQGRSAQASLRYQW